MLQKQPWMKGLSDLSFELRQAEEEGKAIPEHLKERALELTGRPVTDRRAVSAAEEIYEEIQGLPQRPDYPYVEPNTLEEIQAERPSSLPLPACSLTEPELYDRIYGAWLGRCSGCLLGQPVEGWRRDRIQGLLKDSDNLPLRRYISSDLPEELRLRYDVTDGYGPYGADKKGWINNVSYMPEDDDTNYTILALKLIEERGTSFTSVDVAELWLSSLPLLHTCTAERMAYLNLANLVPPPASAVTHNPYREWIGAQIRGDLFGYINPGKPETAAAMAWRDASISHVKNGIYGEMFVAAMLAAAYVIQEPSAIVEAGLAQIPRRSRLTEEIRRVIAWRRDGLSKAAVIDELHNNYQEKDGHKWCHTIPNAMLVTIGLLYGESDFTASIAVGTEYGFDTDCNSATIGSVVGLALGSKGIPKDWISPLNDTIKSGVDGFGLGSISELARRTARLCKP